MEMKRPRSTFLFAIFLAALALAAAWSSGHPLPGPGEPELPRVFLDTRYVPPGGRVITVAGGKDLQDALDDARPGDTIRLEAGASFVGNFTLPNKGSSSAWIVIRTDLPDSGLPPEGTRITPARAVSLAKILSANSAPAVDAADGASHYRFVGVEIGVTENVRANANLIRLGNGKQETPTALPSHIILDRCYIHGNDTGNIRRGVALNGSHLAVIDSYLENFHEAGTDSQAIAGWNGPGPFKIVNNFLEAAGENVMFGGAVPAIPGVVPSDIEIRRNHFYKRLSWREGDPGFAGTAWQVKNLFELKNAQRLLVEGNVLEYSWADAQVGFAVLIKGATDGGRTPWATTSDLTFRHNIVRHAANGVNLAGRHPQDGRIRLLRVKIHDNLFLDINGPRWGNASQGRLFQVLGGPHYVTLDHNTGFQTNFFISVDGYPPGVGLVVRNNIVAHARFGVKGSGARGGSATLEKFFEDYVFSKNVMVGGNCALYPGGNFCPGEWEKLRFADLDGGDYRLAARSTFKKAGTDGRDIGADIEAIEKATAGVVQLEGGPAVTAGKSGARPPDTPGRKSPR